MSDNSKQRKFQYNYYQLLLLFTFIPVIVITNTCLSVFKFPILGGYELFLDNCIGQATSCIPGHEPSLYLRVCCINTNLGKTVHIRENNHMKIILCPSVKPHSCSSIMT